MKKAIFAFVILMVSGCATPQKEDMAVAEKVAIWQMNNMDPDVKLGSWINATFYRGLVELAELTGSEQMWGFMKGIGDEMQWDMLPRVYDGDDLCIGQSYVYAANHFSDPSMLDKVRERIQYVMANPDTNALITPEGKYYRGRWGWCDALFMAPPVYAAMARIDGREDYLDYCWSEYKVTTDSLYNRDYSLYHRDLSLVAGREDNGELVFWGRGNGWVYGGLTFMLEEVPQSHPSYQYYLDLYKEMSASILALQDKRGSWHSGMLDPEHWNVVENSASAFFTYGLAWGVNHGILGKEYKKAAKKGWKALKSYVTEDGRLCYVQKVGHDPANPSEEDTLAYGVGAFLLAATEMVNMK